MHWQIISLIILPLPFSCKAEKHSINCSSENVEVYNMPFSLEEVQDVLRRAHSTSAGSAIEAST